MEVNLGNDLINLRNQAPLVHNITNFVVMNFTANALLSVGASPVMAHAVEEVAEMVSHAGALVINIGTLSGKWIEGMEIAMARADALHIPIILDPVGAGATSFRNESLQRLLSVASPTIIRGNASEIMSLAGQQVQSKGVDSTGFSTDALTAAQSLAKKYACVVSVSGATDVIVGEGKIAYLRNGNEIMTRVTGMGCASSALAGAFSAVQNDPFLAAISAAAMMGVAGDRAYELAQHPGSFQMSFLDQLASLQPHELEERASVEFEYV
ncbi:hydroxyethylthiazole kinase [Dyadobacter tibetensis]|uniref:hydroxyethylthiazole kinase n=1 Tax=Dyadobacter tibetensis TaxID=1211851 RepID=UPI0004B61046|nr:hydroxyethylthiazole kinase [Dyadobacter tibetensis]